MQIAVRGGYKSYSYKTRMRRAWRVGRIPRTYLKGKEMKLFIIGIFIAIGILDVLLIVGSAKLERMREKNEGNNRKV